MRSRIGWRGEQNISCKCVEMQTCFKTTRLMAVRNGPKRTIFASGELGLLQMVSNEDTGRCASEKAELCKRWTRGGVSTRTLGLKGGWIRGPHRWRRE